jgi:hypothetical protein
MSRDARHETAGEGVSLLAKRRSEKEEIMEANLATPVDGRGEIS